MSRAVLVRALRLIAWLALMSIGPVSALGQPAQSPPLTAAQAQSALDVLQNPQKRAQVIAVLQAIAHAAPPQQAGDTAPKPPAPKPSAPKPSTHGPKPAAKPVLRPHSLGAELLVTLTGWGDRLGREAIATLAMVDSLPDVWRWALQLEADPASAATVGRAAAVLAAVFAAALLLEFAAAWAMRRPREALLARLPRADSEHTYYLRLLPFALVRLLFDLIPVGVFAAAGNLALAAAQGLDPRARLVVVAVINAYAACRAAICIVRMLAAPDDARVRLWRLDDSEARFVLNWSRWLIGVAIFGNAFVEVGALLGLDDNAKEGFARLVALVLVLMVIAVVLRSRRDVAGYLRRRGRSRWWSWLADAWPYLAIIAILTFWVGLSTSQQGAFASLYFPGVTLAAIIIARLMTIIAFGAVERLFRAGAPVADTPGLSRRMAYYRRPLELLLNVVITVFAVIVLLQLWGAPAFAWLARGIGHRLLSALVTIALAAAAAIVAWEGAQAMVEREVLRLGEGGQHRSARLLTLLPMLRAALLATIATVVGLTALSEIGVNIAPLLAGAGIVGIAVGFGAQHLVQDVITGMFVVFEDAIKIGDSVMAAGLSGSVEQLSVRTLRLRAGDGSLHIIPFSAVSSITNSNRGLGNAVIAVTVDYNEDTDRVAAALREIAAEMRAEAEFAPMMLGELQVFGVDQVRPWGATMTGQIPCTDAGRWPVQREFNRRLKKRFTELNIALGGPPFAAQ